MEDSIFDYLKDVLFQKRGVYKTHSSEQLNFSPFMLQRWCSMADETSTKIINETSNKWLRLMSDEKQVYQLFFTVLPKIRSKRVAYIKKNNKSTTADDIKDISTAAELSTREVREALDFFKDLNL